ncbi:MAG: hypothetical protein Q8P81_00440 [Nanoarchaeota archaeon]|nr:hypothetical protein [Nanoarchaeota archaeon]
MVYEFKVLSVCSDSSRRGVENKLRALENHLVDEDERSLLPIIGVHVVERKGVVHISPPGSCVMGPLEVSSDYGGASGRVRFSVFFEGENKDYVGLRLDLNGTNYVLHQFDRTFTRK